MRSTPWIVVILLAALPVRAETLAELVAKEEGVDFGECILTPKPEIPGEKIVAVLPARFPEPSSWQTYELLLVGVNGEAVQKSVALKLKDGINPREAQVLCKKDVVTLTELSRNSKPKVRRYRWDGKKLKPMK